jgi:uncharacterized DUF497 family protein
MDYQWDEAKRSANLAKHGVDFTVLVAFEWGTAMIKLDMRQAYGELRFRALGLIQGGLYTLIFTGRGPRVRAISLRKASRKEKAEYEAAT